MEKVINEFKVVETGDGFRIEIKGNKEAIRRMLCGFGPFWSGFGGWGGPWEWSEEEEKK